MTLREYLRVLRERARLITTVAVLTTVLGVLIVKMTPPTYQATAQVLITSNSSSLASEQYGGAQYITSLISTFAAVVDSEQVVSAVRRDLNLGLTDQQLRAKLHGSVPSGQNIVLITATDGDAGQSAALANSAATAFTTAVATFNRPTSASASTVHPTITNRAVEPSTPVSPRPFLDITVAVLLGLLLGFAAAVLREVLDNRIKTPEALARLTARPVLGVVVDDPGTARHPIATHASERNARAENFRQLRANLQFANVDKHPRVIAITSSIPTEGKTMVAINLASTLAEAGFTVCLIDADLRRPTVAKVLGLVGPVGLTNVLIHQLEPAEALQQAGPNLSVLSSGPTPPNPSEVLASTYVRQVVRSLLETVDYVVIDTAPLLPVADGSEVAALADGTLLVARHALTTDAQVKRAAANLRRVDAVLLGVVLNRMPNKRTGAYGYGYGYGYGYYRGEAPVRGRRRAKRGMRRTPNPATVPVGDTAWSEPKYAGTSRADDDSVAPSSKPGGAAPSRPSLNGHSPGSRDAEREPAGR